MQKIRFVPTDVVPPGYRAEMSVETIPAQGDFVFLNGVPYAVENREHRFMGGSEGIVGPVNVFLVPA